MRSSRINIAAYLMALIIVGDQLSKWWVLNELAHPMRGMAVTPFLNLILVWNKGVTFGLLNRVGHGMVPWILIGAALVILLLLSRWLWRTTSMAVAVGLGGIMGGAIGNVIDRLRYGAVVDFLDFHYRGYHWYAFNIADAAIVAGIGLLMLDSLVRGR